MSTLSIQRAQIARTIRQGWRTPRMPTAKFERPDGFFLVEVWFEDGKPRMQVRSGANDLEEAGLIGIALQMAIEWVAEVISKQ